MNNLLLTFLASADARIDVGTGPNRVNIPTLAANQATIDAILNTVYLWAGVVAVIAMIIGGVLYIISNGDANKITQAKNTILYGVVGLVVVLLAFAITQLVIFMVR